jgi:hypothetical protein
LFYYGGVRVAHRVSLLGSVEFIFLFYYGGVRVAQDKLSTTQKTNTMSNTNPTIIKQKDKLNTTQKTNTMSNTNPTIKKQKDKLSTMVGSVFAHRVSLLGSAEFIFLFYYGGVRVWSSGASSGYG